MLLACQRIYSRMSDVGLKSVSSWCSFAVYTAADPMDALEFSRMVCESLFAERMRGLPDSRKGLIQEKVTEILSAARVTSSSLKSETWSQTERNLRFCAEGWGRVEDLLHALAHVRKGLSTAPATRALPRLNNLCMSAEYSKNLRRQPAFTVCVERLSGQQLVLDMGNRNPCISQIKERIEKQWKIRVDLQMLMVDSRPLEDSEELPEFENPCHVTLVVSMQKPLRCLEHSDYAQRLAALHVLAAEARKDDEEVLEAVMRCCTDASGYVRAKAARTLPELCHHRNSEALQALLLLRYDQDFSVQNAAAAALARFPKA